MLVLFLYDNVFVNELKNLSIASLVCSLSKKSLYVEHATESHEKVHESCHFSVSSAIEIETAFSRQLEFYNDFCPLLR